MNELKEIRDEHYFVQNNFELFSKLITQNGNQNVNLFKF